MRLDDLVFVTSNIGKLREAEAVLGCRIDHRQLELPELQTLDLHHIVRDKAKSAWQKLRRPVLVEDTSLELAGLGGFPGPLVKWLLSTVGAEGVCKVAECFEDARATARCLICATDGDVEVFGEGVVEGLIAPSPRGDGGFGWDSAFAPADLGGRTYGEMSEEEKNLVSHRFKAFVALRDALTDG